MIDREDLFGLDQCDKCEEWSFDVRNIDGKRLCLTCHPKREKRHEYIRRCTRCGFVATHKKVEYKKTYYVSDCCAGWTLGEANMNGYQNWYLEKSVAQVTFEGSTVTVPEVLAVEGHIAHKGSKTALCGITKPKYVGERKNTKVKVSSYALKGCDICPNCQTLFKRSAYPDWPTK